MRGFGRDEVGEQRLTPALPDMRASVIRLTVATLASAAAGVALFGWDARTVLVWGTIGVAAWGTLSFFSEVRGDLPSARPRPPPPGAVVRRERREALRGLGTMLLISPVLLGLVWFADAVELGPLFVPGQLGGYAAAHLVGAFVVARWQRRTGCVLLLDRRTDDAGPYVLSRS